MSNWIGKVVVVTGGSKGLGRAIAIEFAAQGAVTIVLARNKDQLDAMILEAESSARDLAEENVDVQIEPMVCDVTSDQSVSEVVAQIVEQFGGIDAWVNNVGRSIRTKIEDATVEQFRDLMEINFLTVVRCTRAVLAHLEDASGYLVNIGSLSAKTAWPLVAPYTTSKHAVAAYTQQLRIEGPRNVHYLLVCPGPILREDAGSRYDDQAEEISDAARKPGAGAPVKGIPPEVLAQKIVTSCERKKNVLILPRKSKLLFILAQISSRMGDALLTRLSNKK